MRLRLLILGVTNGKIKIMSKFKNHLSENITIGYTQFKRKDIEDFIRFWTELEKKCNGFIKELTTNNKSRNMLLRGSNGAGPDFFTRNPRTDRKPSDMPDHWHKAFDAYFVREFGWKVRSEGLFCTGLESLARGYGDTTLMVFPINGYSYVWSPEIPDLYVERGNHEDISDFKVDDELISRWTSEYYENYGEEGDRGYWNYNGDVLSNSGDNKAEAIKHAIEYYVNDIQYDIDHAKESIETQKNTPTSETSIKLWIEKIVELEKRMKNLKFDIEDGIEWYPDYDIDYFIEKKQNQLSIYDITDKMWTDKMYEICQGNYINYGLTKALDDRDGNEIMVKCKKYYAISNKYNDIVLKLLFEKGYDINQLELELLF